MIIPQVGPQEEEQTMTKRAPLEKKPSEVSWVYILEVDGGRYYTGWTANLQRRFEAHWSEAASKGGAKFTKGFRPKRVAAIWEIEGFRAQGQRLESFIKSQSRVEKEGFVRKPETLAQRFYDAEEMRFKDGLIKERKHPFAIRPLTKTDFPR